MWRSRAAHFGSDSGTAAELKVSSRQWNRCPVLHVAYFIYFCVDYRSRGGSSGSVSPSLCLYNGPPLVFGRLQTLLRRQPEQGEEGANFMGTGSETGSKKKKERGRGSTFSDGGGSSVLWQYNSVTHPHTHIYLAVGHWHIGLRSWIIGMCLSSVIDLAATLR